MFSLPQQAEQPGMQEMSQIRVLLLIACFLALSSCGSGSTSSVFTPETRHPKNWVNPAYIGTDDFHGSHVSITNGTPAGTALFTRRCAGCHGSDGSGKIGPNIQGRTASQIKTFFGIVIYMKWQRTLTDEDIQAISSFLADPKNNEMTSATTIKGDTCKECHGSDLTGGIAKISCFSCHKDADGTVGHASGWLSQKDEPVRYHGHYAKNYAVACTTCHGPDLKGPAVPSCYKCHTGTEWDTF